MKTKDEIEWEERCQNAMDLVADEVEYPHPRDTIRELKERNVRLDGTWSVVEIDGFWAHGDMYPFLRPYDPDDPEDKDSRWNDIESSFKAEVWDKHASGSPEEGFLHTSHIAQWMKKNLPRQWKSDEEDS